VSGVAWNSSFAAGPLSPVLCGSPPFPLDIALTCVFLLSGALHATYTSVTGAVLKALRLCDNLYSFTWVDDTSASPSVFLSFLNILRGLPLRALTLRTYSDLGEDTWAFLNTFPELEKVGIWCMHGPPRVLQGWAPLLGGTLTELELGVRSGHLGHGS
jgi:hypothetical protein